MYVVNVFEKVSTNYFNNLTKDPILRSQKKNKEIIYAICTRIDSFGIFFAENKNYPLSPQKRVLK
jgi:hypothetical protein